MKNIKKLFTLLALGMTLTAAMAVFASCNASEASGSTGGSSSSSSSSSTSSSTSTSGSEEEDDSFDYAGEYTYTDGGVVYKLTVLANTDYEMSITKTFDGFTATKYYAGPLKDISGNVMAEMPVFLSDFQYEGDKAPTDGDDVCDKLTTMFTAYRTAAQTEEERFFYITLDKTTMTFAPNAEKNASQNTSLDYTSAYWLSSDFTAEE